MKLRDVERAARENPGTYSLPSIEDRRTLIRGELAEVDFGQERMWVRVSTRTVVVNTGRTRYVGHLENNPIILNLKQGDEICFGPQNICDIRRTL